jgi:hypothetical protein
MHLLTYVTLPGSRGNQGIGSRGQGIGRGTGGRGRGRGRGIGCRGRGSTSFTNRHWEPAEKDDDIPPPSFTFSEATGLNAVIQQNSPPVVYFRHLFSDDIITLLVDETNR